MLILTFQDVFQDFNKVLVNFKQELILKRSKDDTNCCMITSAVPAAGVAVADPSPKVIVTAIQWIMPHITTSDSEKLSIQNLMSQNEMLQIEFRSFELQEYPIFPKPQSTLTGTTGQSEKPTYIMFAFQTDQDSKARNRSDVLDHCCLKNLKVFLNSDYYPYNDLNLVFSNYEVSKAYELFVRFRESYYNVSPNPSMSRTFLVKKYLMIVVDVNKQNESIKKDLVDIDLVIETSANLPVNTTACCL